MAILYYYCPLNYTTYSVFCFVILGWHCMVINISVQYNGGLLPDIILLIQGYYHRGARLTTI